MDIAAFQDFKVFYLLPHSSEHFAGVFPLQATRKTKPSTSTATCSSLDSLNESETVQKANAYKLEQDAEDTMNEILKEKMLSEDLKKKLLNGKESFSMPKNE